MRIGEQLRYGRSADYPSALQQVDGMTNWWYATKTADHLGLPSLTLDRGISAPAPVVGVSPRIPCIAIRSSPHKAGSDMTPWEDVHRPDDGYSRYFGDNKIESGRTADDSLGNRRLLRAMELQHGDRTEREAAPPVLVFEAFPYKGRPKGQVIFHGVGVITSAERVVQRDPSSRNTFTNYRFDIALLDLSVEDDELDWNWINSRRERSVSLPDCLELAPTSWRTWVRDGSAAVDRLQRRVISRHVKGDGEQRPRPGSADAQILQAIYDFYRDRRHRFEVVAEHVTAQILQAQGMSYKPGWVTRGSGDGGVDFVGRIDLDREGGFPSSRQVVLGQAKCEALDRPTNGVHLARLAARLRRGWVGAFVTTSYFSRQVQQEIYADRLPLILINGRRLASVLRAEMLSENETILEVLQRLDATHDGRLGVGDPEQVLL